MQARWVLFAAAVALVVPATTAGAVVGPSGTATLQGASSPAR